MVMAAPIIHRVRVALDCECGTTVEACDDEELLDELLEQHRRRPRGWLRREPAAMLAEAFGA